MDAAEVLNVLKEQNYFDRRDYSGAKAFIREHKEAFITIPSTLQFIDSAFEVADRLIESDNHLKSGGQKIYDAATIGAVGSAYRSMDQTLSSELSKQAEFDNRMQGEIGKMQELVKKWTVYDQQFGESTKRIPEALEAKLKELSSSIESIPPQRELLRLYILAELMQRGQTEVASKIGVLQYSH